MDIDKTTIKDLSIFENEGEDSIFTKFDLTVTSGGSNKLKSIFLNPLKDITEINNIQHTIQYINERNESWPKLITNGTLMVVMKFYESIIDKIPPSPNEFLALQYKLLHGPDFSLAKYSAGHAFDLIRGMRNFIDNYKGENVPLPLQKIIATTEKILERDQLKVTIDHNRIEDLPASEILKFAYFVRYVYKDNILDLINIFYQLDAWRSMGLVKEKFNLIFPSFIQSDVPHINSQQLYHILLPKPVSYDVLLNEHHNFIFLTGANMAGKSTFIKSIGAAVYLAHLGMAVPATQMELSLFNGILSNINVVDNISKGESYFYNEVQRIKNTIIKITDGKKWLVLIDELFKGTNVQDAMSCSTAVIKGLIKIKTSLFILSTHLYEIGESLKVYSNISFKYFETSVDKEQLFFSYQLQNGISNDRLGYLILKREKVIELLEQL